LVASERASERARPEEREEKTQAFFFVGDESVRETTEDESQRRGAGPDHPTDEMSSSRDFLTETHCRQLFLSPEEWSSGASHETRRRSSSLFVVRRRLHRSSLFSVGDWRLRDCYEV